MKKCYLDANVLICFKNEDSPLFDKAQKLIRNLIKNSYKIYVSPLVVDEFLHPIKFVLEGKKVKDIYPILQKALKDVLSLPNLEIVNFSTKKSVHLEIVSLMEKFNLKPRDAYHLLTMKENKIRFFATLDSDFDLVFKKGAVLKI